MKCFICKKIFSSVENLIVHLKIYHSLSSHRTFQCCEESCSQLFSNIHNFKRHLKTKHLQDFNNYAIETNFGLKTSVQSDRRVSVFKDNKIDSDQLFSGTSNNITSFSKDLFLADAANFSVSLHNNNNFTKKNVEDVQKLVTNTILGPVATYLSCVTSHISNLEAKAHLENFICYISDPFAVCKTDYLMNKWLKNNCFMEDCVQFSIDESVRPVIHNGNAVYDDVNTKGILLPIQFQFKKYFEKSDVLQKTLNKIQLCEEEQSGYSNFIQGNLWQKKVATYESGEICIPYFLYFDDFEINNPLGTHCQPICGIYYSFPLSDCSELDHIFVAGFVKSQDIKKIGNESSLKYLINQINEMENEGIILNTENGNVKVRFILELILGDNLGLNSLLGFSKSFSSSYFCRFCKTSKQLSHKMIKEDSKNLRNIENFEHDIRHHSFKETGIKEDSPFNRIASFHVVHNYAVDMMHDLFEGICHYDICQIIKYYIQEIKIFSLETLNLRKQTFNYGQLEIENFSKQILETHLNQNRLKMTASEMKGFIRLFPLIIGDLIAEDDKVCCLSTDDISLLRELISEHNEKYVALFSDNLKPKHHLLIHYPTIIENSGPPKYFWCFRFEGKHKEVKTYANVTTSRKNILLTLAKKYQFKFSHLLMTPDKNEIIFEESHKLNNECIDLDALKIMTPQHLKQLGKKWNIKLGIQIKFENCLINWKNNRSAPAVCSNPNINLMDSKNKMFNENINSSKEIDIAEIMNATSQGRSVLDFFKNNLKLNDLSRAIVVDLTTNYLIQNDIPMTVNLASKIAESIVQVFQSESLEYYYLKQSGKKPQGKLYDKYFNLMRKLKQGGIVQKRPYSNKTLDTNKRILNLGKRFFFV
ncbi:hypothetical protein CVS40_11351 [Lucilia cuprina]|nr:hypothetical protein CVS40_11351 [Lucilia cuprina]